MTRTTRHTGGSSSAQNAIRVLLLSPVRRWDPPNGDVTYTELLANHPPKGVVYETYDVALAAGRLIETGRRSACGGRRDTARWLREAAVNRLRRRGYLFREPFRFFQVTAGEYDLVHVHVFSVRLIGWSGPTVVSNALPLPVVYRDAWRWSAAKVGWATVADQWLAKLSRVEHSSLRLRKTDAVVTFTDHLAKWYRSPSRRGRAVLVTIPPGIPRPALTSAAPRTPTTVGFVAHHHAAKGGDVLLRAWSHVLAQRPDARLILAGGSAQPPLGLPASVSWLGSRSRDQLLAEFYPALDVFAYPSTFDGSPLVVKEALSFGIPVVVSDYGALPEMVGNGSAGRVVPGGSERALAQAIVELLSEAEHRKASAAASRLFAARFEQSVVHERLGRLYRSLLT